MLKRLFQLTVSAWVLGQTLYPAQAQTPGTTAAHGLRGQYYAGKNFEKLVLMRIDAVLDFDWSLGPPNPYGARKQFVAPGPGVPAEWFSVRWQGYVYAPTTGSYTFEIATDDGMRVWIGGRPVLTSWADQPTTRVTTQMTLTAGRYYSLRVEYYQVDRDSRALLAWKPPGTPADAQSQPIPTDYLYVTPPAATRPIAPPVVRATPVVRAAPVASATVAASAARPVIVRQPALAVPRNEAPVTPVAAAPAATSADTLPNLAALSKGAAVTLPNLYFAQSTAALLPDSRPVLNQLARRLRTQPTLRLEIAGHTDNVGEAAKNLLLSEQRAQVVRRYLVQQGIDSVRLTARGYGGTRPVADNADPQQRPRNRRVEVVVQ